MKRGPSRRRGLPVPVWLLAVWLLLLGPVAWLWLGDPGDSGFRNAVTIASCSLATGAGFLWFALSARFPRRLRFAVVGVVAVVGMLLVTFLEVRGFSGSMIPSFGLRFGAEPDLGVASGGPAAVDLTRSDPRDFPGFLGPRRDLSVEGVRLAGDWTSRPPEIAWRRAVGPGWSGFACVNGVAVTMEQRGDEEVVAAYELETGAPLWSTGFPGRFENFLGGIGPRATPFVEPGPDGGRVYVQTAFGRFACLAGADGAVLWERDLRAEHGVTPEMEAANVQYGRSSSPLVHGELAILNAGGDASTRMAGLLACDKRTGETVWASEPRQLSFASPSVVTLLGVEQLLIVNEDSVSAHDLADGRILWEHAWPGKTSANASVSQAVALPPDRVLLSKGYGVGSAVLRLRRVDDRFGVEPVWRNRRTLRTKLTNAAVLDGHAYGLSDGILECVDLASGERVWKDGRYGHGQILRVGRHLLVMSEEGELVLVEATPEAENRVLGRLPLLDGKAWNNLALFGGSLCVRNAEEAVLVRLPLEDGDRP